MKRASSIAQEYQGYRINNTHEGFYPVMMERILNCHNYATTQRKRNLFLMLTFTVPQNILYQENTYPSFLEAFIRQANREGLAPVYFWTREQELSQNPHFHLCLWLSGYLIRNSFGIITDVQARWNRWFGLPPDYRGLVGYSNQQPFLFLDRDSSDYQENYQAIILWASYAAKVAEKSTTPHCRAFGSSCL